MNEHLPECLTAHGDPPAWCICDELRACEDRVRGEEQQRIEAALTFVGQHDAAWELAIRGKALREARNALAALRGCIGPDGIGDGTGCTCHDVPETISRVRRGSGRSATPVPVPSG